MKHTRKDYQRIQDPLNLIPENEPVFLLRAKDVLSIPLLTRYRELVEANGTDVGQKEMVDNIEDCINQFRNWQTQSGAEMPTLKGAKEIADISAAYELAIAPDGKEYALTQEIEELKEIREVLKEATRNIRVRLTTMEAREGLAAKQAEANAAQLKSFEKENENLKNEIVVYGKAVEDQKDDIKNLQGALKDNYIKMHETQEENAALKNENVSLKEQNESLIKRNDEQNKIIKDFESEAQDE